ncbi:hypothetical protein MIR68_002604 [Amoeboaphelidium protococcarum]|nr:hypothetical protein MIR68_002604 [Amoeboaphelidium protococcarum]
MTSVENSSPLLSGTPGTPRKLKDNPFQQQIKTDSLSRPSSSVILRSPAEYEKQTEPVQILLKPGIPVKCAHPLLKHLSYMPQDGDNYVPPPVKGQRSSTISQGGIASQSTQKLLAANNVLKNIANPLKFSKAMSGTFELFSRIPPGSILKCKLIRKSKKLYTLTNETDDKVFLYAAHVSSSPSTFFVGSDMNGIVGKGTNEDPIQNTFVAKIVSDKLCHQFTVYDTRNIVKLTEAKKPLPAMAFVSYQKKLPKAINIGLRSKLVLDDLSGTSEPFTEDIAKDFEAGGTNKLVVYKSKKPNIDERSKQLNLDFGGRVLMSSIKNFQIVDVTLESQPLILQFGKIDENSFALDILYPFCPIDAFGLALSVFDAYVDV